MKEWKECLLKGSFQGKLTGILHTYNDRLADVVADEGTNVLYGQSFFYEQLLNLKFKITPFSFFKPIPRVQKYCIKR